MLARMRRVNRLLAFTACGALGALSGACGSNSNGMAANVAGTSGGGTAQAGDGSTQAGGGAAAGGTSATAGSTNVGGGRPAGWLYADGAKLKLSDGKGSGSVWVGRGVNLDDIFFCGYNGALWMPAPADELKKVIETLITGWKPTFIRLSLGMASQQAVSWFADTDKYQKPMLDVMSALGKHDGVYVLLTLRSDASMIGHDMADGDPEATGIPSDSQTSPDKTKFPSGTDAVYTALVDAFKNDKFVLFGLTNEPGGNKRSNDQIRGAMDHAVKTIRAEEDKLGVPHHVVAVQGQAWTSDISFYAQTPLSYDNVVYEVHGYPPAKKSYTYDSIPVIIGEYGGLDATSAPAFFADLEATQVSSLAWDFDSYSNCAPDLLQVNQSSTDLKPSDWSTLVQAYLLAHSK